MTLKEVVQIFLLTNLDAVAASVEQLMIEGKREFTVEVLCEKVREIDPTTSRSSILSTLSSLVYYFTIFEFYVIIILPVPFLLHVQ